MVSGLQLGVCYEKICSYCAHCVSPNLVRHVPFYSDRRCLQ